MLPIQRESLGETLRRLKLQIVLLALCLAATLTAKYYVDKLLASSRAQEAFEATATAGAVPAEVSVQPIQAPGGDAATAAAEADSGRPVVAKP